jgi:predicted MFS family arabinose efflux permease
MDRRLPLLAAGAFVVTTDGTLVVGLLRQIARDLAVSPGAAGQAVTVFAAVYAFATPVVIRATRGVRRKRLLVGALFVFSFANAGTAAAPTLLTLLIARTVAAGSAGVFMATAAAVVADAAPRDQRGRRLATIVGGASAATALGVPVGTFLGGTVGWRAVFYGVCALTTLVALATAATAPAEHGGKRTHPTTRRSGRKAVLILATTLLWSSGSFTFFAYVAVVVHRTASVGSAGLAGLLLLFGVVGAGGAAVSGRLTDSIGPLPTLTVALALIVVALTGLGVTSMLAAGGPAAIGCAAAIAVYGAGTWAVVPPQQHRLLDAAGDPQVLLSLNASALYGGVAVGGALGGTTLAATHSTTAVCWVAAAVELCALVLVAVTRNSLSDS